MLGGVGVGPETYLWNGSTWTNPTNGGPQGRRGHAMAFDALRGNVIMFGGTTSAQVLGETWSWDGASWTLLSPASSPAARYAHAMSYDSLRGVIVLFGGVVAGAADTWEWNGSHWVPRFSAQHPSGRYYHAMAYDSSRGQTVLFGGQSANGMNDTWEWDGVNWFAKNPNTVPSARFSHAMAYHAQLGRVVMHGGALGSGTSGVIYSDTWEWDGANWVLAAPLSSPGSRRDAAMAYDAQRHRVVLFGGEINGLLSDTWEYGQLGTQAIAHAFGSGCGSPALLLGSVPASRPILGQTQDVYVANIPQGVGFMSLGVSNAFAGPFQLPLALDGFSMPGCSLLQSAEATSDACLPTGPGNASYSLAIPNALALVGVHVYMQSWAPAPGQNFAGVIVSNGLELAIGDV